MPDVIVPANYIPRHYQMPLWSYMDCGEEPAYNKRAACVWHRRGGKDLTAISLIASEAFKRIGTYWHLFPTLALGKKIIWTGSRKDGLKFRSVFPAEIVESENSTDMMMTFTNGSVYNVVGAENFAERLIGPNPVGIVISEWSVMDPMVWGFLSPMLAENEGWALFIFTPRGKNHAYRTFQSYMRNPKYFAQLLTVDDTQAMSPAALAAAIEDLREQGFDEDFIKQEFWCSFDRQIPGSYYGELMNTVEAEGRQTRVPYDPALETYTAWDLGVNDCMAIWVWQQHGAEIRVLKYIQNTGKGLEWYIHELNETKWRFTHHYAPHDIKVRELVSGETRQKTARKMGVRFRRIPKISLQDGINAVRSIIPRCYFDSQGCENGPTALKDYHAERDPRTQETKDQPAKTWHRHGADAFRMMALAIKGRAESSSPKPPKKKRQETAHYQFNPLK